MILIKMKFFFLSELELVFSFVFIIVACHKSIGDVCKWRDWKERGERGKQSCLQRVTN